MDMKYLVNVTVALLVMLDWVSLAPGVWGQSLDFRYHTIDDSPNGSLNDVCLVGDLDRDGDHDIVIGGKKGDLNLVWYEYRGHDDWVKHPIGTANLEAGGLLADVDLDGDLDIVVGQPRGRTELYWFECPDNPREPWRKRVITQSYDQYHDQAIGDVDRDGKLEVVFASQGARKLLYVTIPDDPTVSPWPAVREIAAVGDEGLLIVDLDHNGKPDVLLGGRWFELQENTWTMHPICDYASPRVAVADLDLDGDLEAVLSEGERSQGRLAWFDSDDPPSGVWREHLLSSRLSHPHSLQIADFNGDGLVDIMVGEMGLSAHSRKRVIIYLNSGNGEFEERSFITPEGTHESKVIDYDGDGDWDIVVKPYAADRLGILENVSSPKVGFPRFTRVVIDSTKAYRSVFIIPADIDMDGWPDLVTGRWWYQNPGPAGAPWRRHEVGNSLGDACAVYDIDQDGDLDILGTMGTPSNPSPDFVWAENQEKGKAWVEHQAFSLAQGDFLQGCVVGQFMRRYGSEVALSWHESGVGIWLAYWEGENTDEWHVDRISTFSQDEALSKGDIDLDGDLDILLGTFWAENRMSDGGGWQVHEIDESDFCPDRNELADIDRDGDLDAVVGEESPSRLGRVVWFENPRVPGQRWREYSIGQAVGPMSLDVGDIDRDGDLDVVVGEHNLHSPQDARVIVYENAGNGTQWYSHILSSGYEHHDGTILVDVDHDGRLDIASISWSSPELVLLYLNRRIESTLGDAELLVRFRAVQQRRTVVLEWETGREEGLIHFVLVRRSSDGHAQQIGRIRATGDAYHGNVYFFRDSLSSGGSYIYELMGLYSGGTQRLLGRTGITVSFPKEFWVSKPYPSPAANRFSVQYELPYATDVKIEVVNTIGRLVFASTLKNESEGRHTFRWPPPKSAPRLPTGIYLVRFSIPGAVAVRKVAVVQAN